MDYVYIPVTISVCKDGVCLFGTDCEAKCDYSLPDGRTGTVDWNVSEFHFDACGTEPGKRIYTKISRHEPLFHVLYNAMSADWIDARLHELLADSDIIELYPAPARD